MANQLVLKNALAASTRVASLLLFALISLLTCLNVQAAEPTPRIVGGTVVPDNRYPFMVSLFYDDDRNSIFEFGCGGSLISRTWVLTAAHCIVNADDGTVRPPVAMGVLVGALNLQDQGELIAVNNIVVHPDYDIETFRSDVALLELAVPVDFTSIVLPAAGSDVPSIGESAVVAGWGTTSEGGSTSADLREVTLPIIAHVQCLPFYTDKLRTVPNVCAGGSGSRGRDSCQGDSGGPLFVVRNGLPVQAGIVSFGDGCARPNIPGVYVRMSSYSDWVASFVPGLRFSNSGVGVAIADRGMDELTPELLTPEDSVRTGSLQTGQVAAYELSGGVRVELLSRSGDADLSIFNGASGEIDDRSCNSIKETPTDECNVPAFSGRQFALVNSYSASDYEIRMFTTGSTDDPDDDDPLEELLASGSSGIPTVVLLTGMLLLRARRRVER